MRFLELRDSGFSWLKSFLDNPEFDRVRALASWLFVAIMVAAFYVIAPLDDFIGVVKVVAVAGLIFYITDFIRSSIKSFRNRG
jgi:hypothetical protein